MTTLTTMMVRDSAQDYARAIAELDHLTTWGMSRERALTRLGLTEDMIVKREFRLRHGASA